MTLTNFKKVNIDGASGKIETIINFSENFKGIFVLIAHPHPLYGGALNNKVVQTIARAALKVGYNAVRFNFRGVGESAGVFDNGIGELNDMKTVVEYIQKKYPSNKIISAGFSFGASVASQLSEIEKFEKNIFIAPAIKNFKMGKINEESIVIHGQDDEIVALDDVLTWARGENISVRVVPGASHFFHGVLDILQRDLIQYYLYTKN